MPWRERTEGSKEAQHTQEHMHTSTHTHTHMNTNIHTCKHAHAHTPRQVLTEMLLRGASLAPRTWQRETRCQKVNLAQERDLTHEHCPVSNSTQHMPRQMAPEPFPRDQPAEAPRRVVLILYASFSCMVSFSFFVVHPPPRVFFH